MLVLYVDEILEMIEREAYKLAEDIDLMWDDEDDFDAPDLLGEEDFLDEMDAMEEEVTRLFPDGLYKSYAPLYDEMLFLYAYAGEEAELNSQFEYDNPNFPNSCFYINIDGKCYALDSVWCRNEMFPDIKSMSLCLGCETIEKCLRRYYMEDAGVFSNGLLERVYGISDCDYDTIND